MTDQTTCPTCRSDMEVFEVSIRSNSDVETFFICWCPHCGTVITPLKTAVPDLTKLFSRTSMTNQETTGDICREAVQMSGAEGAFLLLVFPEGGAFTASTFDGKNPAACKNLARVLRLQADKLEEMEVEIR